MRDIRNFYIDYFKDFKETYSCQLDFRNKVIKDKFYPFQISECSKELFDKNVVKQMNFQNERLFFEQLMFTVASFIQPKTVINTFEFDRQAIEKKCEQNIWFYKYFEGRNMLHQVNVNRDMAGFLTNDFYGYLKDRPLAAKKMKTLEVYRYFYKFSMEKLMKFSNSPVFQLMLLYYIKVGKMQRIH